MRAEAGLTARSAPGNGSIAFDDAGVDRAEGGGSERGEHARVRSQRFWHALAAHQPGPDELIGVGPVGLRARRAHRRPAVAARDVDRLVRQVLGVQAVENLTGDAVDRPDGATQPDGPDTASSSQCSGQPVVIVIPGGALEQLPAEAPVVVAGSRPIVYQDGGKSLRGGSHARMPVGRQFGIGGHVQASPRVVVGSVVSYTAVRRVLDACVPWTRAVLWQHRLRWRQCWLGVRHPLSRNSNAEPWPHRPPTVSASRWPVLVPAAPEMDVRGLIKASGQRPAR